MSAEVVAGAFLGGLVGYLLRPSVPFIGQLPFETVITRGSNLSGLDLLLLKGAAETSCNYMIVGVLIGGLIGWLLMEQSRKAK